MSNLQKSIKKCAITLGVLLIVLMVVLVCVILSALFSSNDNTFSDTFENITSLYIDIDNSNVTIVHGDEFLIDAQDVSNSFKVISNGSSVKIKDSSTLFGDTGSVVVTVPNSLVELSLDSGRGSVSIDGITASKFEAEFGSGDVEIINSSFTSTEIDGSIGDISISDCTLGKLELDLSSGDTFISAVFDSGSEIDTGIGDLIINLSDSIENYSFYVEKGIGTVIINDDKISNKSTYGDGYKSIKIDGGSGRIEING